MSSKYIDHSSTIMNKRRRGDADMDNGDIVTMDFTESNGSKKVKIEDAPPSKVIHIRNVPNDATEHDIALLGVPFGIMEGMVLSKKVNQALLEMQSFEAAEAMVSYYVAYPPNMYNRNVIVQYSKHQHLETKSHNAAVDQALQSANQTVLSQANKELGVVLRIVVENLFQHTLNYLVMYKIFSRFGRVTRIICFNRNGQFQALIEMDSTTAANAAKLHLNGQNIYTGCCTLRIDFSKLHQIEVRTESDKSRDFERNPLTDAERIALNTPSMGSSSSNSGIGSGGLGGGSSSSGPVGNNFGGVSGFNQSSQMSQLLAAQLSSIANSGGLQGMKATQMLQQSLQQLRAASNNHNVIHVSNLDEDRATPDALFTLFGVYGDVLRVKIMFNKKDNALIQFTDGAQAQQAMENLNGARLWDRTIKLSYSKHNNVQLPREDSDQGYTKDFTNSPLHRYKKLNSKNYNNIFPPSSVLHLSNLPSSTAEDDLKDLFEEHGYNVVNFKFLQKEKKMALIQLESVELAIQALIDLHNWPLSESAHLRVSFSKASFH